MIITYQHERQVAKEETETMRQKLDEGLDDIRNLLNFRVSINYSVMVVTNTEQCRGGSFSIT